MDRIKAVQEQIDAIIENMGTPQGRRAAAVHTYGVAQACALLARKRGLDVELCTVAGLLHDCATYATGDPAWHAHRGAELAGRLLDAAGLFTLEERGRVCGAVYFHSGKDARHDPFTEALVDADVLQHCLGAPLTPPAPGERARFAALCRELGLGGAG